MIELHEMIMLSLKARQANATIGYHFGVRCSRNIFVDRVGTIEYTISSSAAMQLIRQHEAISSEDSRPE